MASPETPAAEAPPARVRRPNRRRAPVCPHCSGTGWRPARPDARPDADAGGVVPCGCSEPAPAPTGLADLGVPRSLRDKTFGNFEEISDALRRTKKTVLGWADRYPDVHAGLLLTGPSGVGKTHLAVAALSRVLRERAIRARARFVYFPELVRTLQRGSGERRPLGDERLFGPALASEILVLDQLGAEIGSAWLEEQLLYLLTRCLHDGVFVIATTAYPTRTPRSASPPGSPDGGPFGPKRPAASTLADKITARAVSVLREACQFVEVRGDDYREAVLQHGLGYY